MVTGFCAGSGGGQTKEDLLGAGEGEPQRPLMHKIS